MSVPDVATVAESDREIVTGLGISPGDRILIATGREYIDPDEAARMQDHLAEAFPGAIFTIVTGVSALAKAAE